MTVHFRGIESKLSWNFSLPTPAVIAEHWTVWLVTVVLIVAAVIDGFELKVPNWVTFPFIVSGWTYSTLAFGWEGLGWSLLGTVVGLALLLPAYAIGGMGAGDVKLLAGVGAWIYGMNTAYAFCGQCHRRCGAGDRHGAGAADLEAALGPVHGNPQRDPGDSESRAARGDRGRAKAHDDAASLWHSDRNRNDRLLRMDGNACMSKRVKSRNDAVAALLSRLPKIWGDLAGVCR